VKIFIGLVTPVASLSRTFGSGKDKIIPRDALSSGFFRDKKPSIAVAAYTPQGTPSSNELERWLLSRTNDSDACLLIVDEAWASLVGNVRNAGLLILFKSEAAAANYKNFFSKTIARLLRNFGVLASRFQNAADLQLLMLPLRNFNAPDLTELARLCRALEPDLSGSIDQQLAILRLRRRTRRRSDSNVTYIVDDLSRFFAYGKEHHSRFGTGESHKPFCELAGYFRFGHRIDNLRHYNVSETEGDQTTIRGDFLDCHDTTHTVNSGTHLNMFSNDYF
jgi:hypothetical protein